MFEVDEVIRPVLARGATVAMVVALAALSPFASPASAAGSPLAGGTTYLSVRKSFEKKLKRNKVKLLKWGSGKVRKRTVQLGVRGGELDTATGRGRIEQSGGFKLRRRKRAVPVTGIRIDLTRKAVFAKVASAKMKFGSLAKLSFARRGLAVNVKAGKLKLTGRAARRLNAKLGLVRGARGNRKRARRSTKRTSFRGGGAKRGLFRGGEVIGSANSTAQLPGQAGGATARAPESKVSGVVDAMTRNLYIGADLEPGFAATDMEAFVAASGQILREVDENDFPTRAAGLAQEILGQRPDLVGLQEVALWREKGEPSLAFPPSATAVRYDFLAELLAELNAAEPEYEVVVSQNEADIETPADVDGDPETGTLFGAEKNIRLTVRDVILARRGAGVQTANASAGHFANLLPVSILGLFEVPVTRGWTATDAKVGAGPWFRFVDTHLESADPPALVPSYRAKQAAELVAPGGPATSDLPVVLVGDLNSDDDTVEPGNRQAYETLLAAGMVERSTDEPLSCCLDSSLLAEGEGGSIEDFDHQVDHVMTRDPAEVTLKSSTVTGLMPVNGFWDSDHAGLFSSLEIVH